MSEDIDPAAGGSGMMLDDDDKKQIGEGLPASPPKKRGPGRPRKVQPEGEETPPPKKKRGRPKKEDVIAKLTERLEDLEARVNASVPPTHTCHMCHRPGAKIQRGNTGEWFHADCLAAYRRGEDPQPIEE